MEFNIAFLENESTIIVKKFDIDDHQSTSTKNIELEDLKNEPIHFLIQNFQNFSREDWLEELSIKFPIIDNQLVSLSMEEFNQLNMDKAKDIYLHIYSGWVVKNNIQYIEKMFENVAILKNLLVQSKQQFVRHLWKNIHQNLGTNFLQLTYNDVEIIESENATDEDETQKKPTTKSKLITAAIEGAIQPKPKNPTSFEETLIKNYAQNVSDPLTVLELSSDKKQLTAILSVNKSPIVIMAKTINPINAFQLAILKSAAAGLQKK